MRSTRFWLWIPALLPLLGIGCGGEDGGGSGGDGTSASSSSSSTSGGAGGSSSSASSSASSSSSSTSGSSSASSSASSTSGSSSSSSASSSSSSSSSGSSTSSSSGGPAPTYSISGGVSGLLGNGLVLRNGDEDLVIDGNGPFAFETRLASGTGYLVTAKSMPSGPQQYCTVNNGVGTVGHANVGNVTVGCSTIAFRVGGTVSGLPAGTTVKVTNNGAGEITLGANGAYQFPGEVASGVGYALAITQQPAGAYCALRNGSGVVEETVENANVVCAAVASCKDIAAVDANAPSGLHRVTLNGALASVWCDMASDGGGWTLAMKANSSATFAFESPIWTSADLQAADSVDLSATPAKLLPYTSVALGAVRLQMVTGGATRGLTLPAPPSASLRALLQGAQSTLGLGRADWFALVPGSGLQEHCNLNGFNIDGGSSKVRFGIVGNENGVGDCGSADSFLGVGATNNCGTGVTVGNVGCHGTQSPEGAVLGSVTIASFAYLYVR